MTTNPPFDQWVEDNSPTDPRNLHAVGLVAYHWNQCEFWLFHLFCHATNLAEEKAWALVYDLGDVAISIRITTLLPYRGFHPDAEALILNALACYDVCRKNRNMLVHAWSESGKLGRMMRKSKDPARKDPLPFPSDLEDIRRVAEETSGLATRLWLLCAAIEDNRAVLPMPWLGKLTPPELLVKIPPPANATPKRQPRSSPASRRKAAMDRAKKT